MKNNVNVKKIISTILGILFIMGMIIILYNMFKDDYPAIIEQLSKTDLRVFAGLLVLGNSFYLIDAGVYKSLIVRGGNKIGYGSAVILSYMSIFFNVLSFGAGIKPAQTAYLYKKGVEPGQAFGYVTMPFVFYKAMVIIYAVVMLIINNTFVMNNFTTAVGYIYGGVGFSIIIITFLILLNTAGWFHKFLGIIIDWICSEKHFNGKLRLFGEETKLQLSLLKNSSSELIRKPAAWGILLTVNAVKLTLWFIIPILSLYACGTDLGSVTISQAITMSALMYMLTGAIPTAGGVGALEVVFSLVFAAVFGNVTAGSCMILYRLTTYYIPFILSIVIVAFMRYDIKKSNEQN